MLLQAFFNSAEYQQFIADRDARDARESNERALGIRPQFSPQQLDRIKKLLRQDDEYRLSCRYKFKKFVSENPIKVTIIVLVILLAMAISALIYANIAALPISLTFKIGLPISLIGLVAGQLIGITSEGRHKRNESFSQAFRNQWIKEFGRN
jgi:hypothetical protein